MKKLLVTLMLVVPAIAFAKPIGKFTFDEHFSESSQALFEVTVDDTKELVVNAIYAYAERNDPLRPFPEFDKIKVNKVFQLKDIVYKDLLDDIRVLAYDEVVTEYYNELPCLLSLTHYPFFGNDHLEVAKDYDYQTGEFSDELELINGPSGCWVAKYIHPKEMKEQAKNLKAKLKILALDKM